MADVIRFSYSSSSLLSSLNNLQPLANFKRNRCVKTRVSRSVDSTSSTPTLVSINNRRDSFLKVHAVVSEATDQPKWWERNAGPNMIDIHSTEEFLSALSEAGDRLVIVEFYGTWCASCRALFPKLCRTATEHPEILFLKVNFDENKAMCKSMNVKVLPYFHFYRGAAGKVEGFSCSLAKFQKIKDAIEMHSPGSSSNNSPAKDDAGLSLESSANVEDNPSANSNT